MNIYFSLGFTKSAITGFTLRDYHVWPPKIFILVCQSHRNISILERMTPDNLVLRPNCLLTRSPLVFISGPRSLFHPQKMAADLQTFIKAHGYQVAPLWLPFRSKKDRAQALEQWLQRNGLKSFHFFMAHATWVEMQTILEKNFHPFSTLNIINLKIEALRSHIENIELRSFEAPPQPSPLLYHLHQIFCRTLGTEPLSYEATLNTKDPTLYDRFLDRCVELAENEYKDLTSRM